MEQGAEFSEIRNYSRIFDFDLSETADGVKFRCYEWQNGKWSKLLHESDLRISGRKGRIAFHCGENMVSGFSSLVQTKDEKVSDGMNWMSEESPIEGIPKAAVGMTTFDEDIINAEIPLEIQYFSEKADLEVPVLLAFYEPERFHKGYDHVYALTVEFYQNKAQGSSEIVSWK